MQGAFKRWKVYKVGKEKELSAELLSAQRLLQRSLRLYVLHIGTVLPHEPVLLHLSVLGLVDVGEAPLLRNDDLLPAGELVTSTTEGFLDDKGIGVLRTDGENDLANVHASGSTVWFAPSATHTSLKPISSSTGQHLVDAKDMVGVDADAKME